MPDDPTPTADGTAAEEESPFPVATTISTVIGAQKADETEKGTGAVTFELDNEESLDKARDSVRESKHPSQEDVDTQATRWRSSLYHRRLMQGAMDNWHWHLKEIDDPNRDLEAQGNSDMSVVTTQLDRDPTQQIGPTIVAQENTLEERVRVYSLLFAEANPIGPLKRKSKRL